MTKTTSRHLLDILAEVPDSRNNRGKRHPLSAILGLAIIAMMCGSRSYAAIAEWGRTYHNDLPKALGFKRKKTPCASTLHYVFKRLDATALENKLTHSATALLENITPETDTHALAIDGKTLCGSNKQNATITHLLSVVSHQLGITLTQQPVDAKTNEIPIAVEILQAFEVSGKIITTDALLTQKDFCQTVCKKKQIMSCTSKQIRNRHIKTYNASLNPNHRRNLTLTDTSIKPTVLKHSIRRLRHILTLFRV